jgi:uncharacterized OB-fold protein
MTQVAIDPGLFTMTADGPRLVGSRCWGCGVVTFPTQTGCPRCNSEEMAPIELPDRGTLWTFTTQAFRPKSPPEGSYLGDDTLDTFEPYTVGYIELPGFCKVESRLTEPDPSKLEIGMTMQLVLVPFRTNDDGDEVVTFAFEPVSDRAES